MAQLPRFEITYHCKDDDWLSWRVQCVDYHAAVQAALDRLNMASVENINKLYGARLLRVERIWED